MGLSDGYKEALITLCSDCHRQTHIEENILVYLDQGQSKLIEVIKCSKCLGTGYVQEYYYHLEGLCFECDGIGYKKAIK